MCTQNRFEPSNTRHLPFGPGAILFPPLITAVCSARRYERVCDERLRAALLNIDKVGWKTVSEISAGKMESAQAGERRGSL